MLFCRPNWKPGKAPGANRLAERGAQAVGAKSATRVARSAVGVAPGNAIRNGKRSGATADTATSAFTAGAGTRLLNQNPKAIPAAPQSRVRARLSDQRSGARIVVQVWWIINCLSIIKLCSSHCVILLLYSWVYAYWFHFTFSSYY